VVAFGRRAGKSETGGKKLVPEAFRAQMELPLLKQKGLRREYWIVGPTYSDSEKEFRVVWNALEGLEFPMDHPGSYNNSESGQMRISLFGGRFIIQAKSAQYPATLVGEGLSGIVFSEAAKLKPSVWIKYLRPTLADFQGWTYFGSTPEGRNWFYELWQIGQDPHRTDWASWRAPAWVNPYVYRYGVDDKLLADAKKWRRKNQIREWLKSVEVLQSDMGQHPAGIDPEVWSLFQDMSSEMFSQEIEALFTEYVGRVFKDFDEEIHVRDLEFNPEWETYACTDYGFTNPFVWLLIQIDPHHERVHVLDEYYEVNRTTGEAAAEIQSRGLAPRTVRMFYPDPAEPDRTRELSQILQLKSGRGTGIELDDRLEWIRRGLKISLRHLDSDHPDGQPMLLIDRRRCPNTIREFNVYKYRETMEQASERGRSAPELPEKKDDHTPEALGRFYSGFFGSPYRAAGGNRQKTARRGR
jgi:hypothetical protein